MRKAFLIILASMLISNTFSPQYLVWLAPFAGFLSDLEVGLLTLASCLTWIYFRYWQDLIGLQPMATGLLLARNLSLILLFVVSVRYIFKKK